MMWLLPWALRCSQCSSHYLSRGKSSEPTMPCELHYNVALMTPLRSFVSSRFTVGFVTRREKSGKNLNERSNTLHNEARTRYLIPPRFVQSHAAVTGLMPSRTGSTTRVSFAGANVNNSAYCPSQSRVPSPLAHPSRRSMTGALIPDYWSSFPIASAGCASGRDGTHRS